MMVLGVMMPSSSAATDVHSLKVEPGAYTPWVARLNMGRRSSFTSSS